MHIVAAGAIAVMLLLAGCASVIPDPTSREHEGHHTLKIRLWDVSEGGVARLLQLSPGSQSRDIGRLIRDETKRCSENPQHRCEVKPHAGEHAFVFEFHHLDFDLVPGSTIARNGVSEPVPASFGKWRNAIEVIVRDGMGTLAIPASWITNDTVLVIHSPWARSSLHYPPSGALRTYGPGESTDGIGEFYRIVKEEGRGDRASNYHFAR